MFDFPDGVTLRNRVG